MSKMPAVKTLISAPGAYWIFKLFYPEAYLFIMQVYEVNKLLSR